DLGDRLRAVLLDGEDPALAEVGVPDAVADREREVAVVPERRDGRLPLRLALRLDDRRLEEAALGAPRPAASVAARREPTAPIAAARAELPPGPAVLAPVHGIHRQLREESGRRRGVDVAEAGARGREGEEEPFAGARDADVEETALLGDPARLHDA